MLLSDCSVLAQHHPLWVVERYVCDGDFRHSLLAVVPFRRGPYLSSECSHGLISYTPVCGAGDTGGIDRSNTKNIWIFGRNNIGWQRNEPGI